MIQYEFQVVEFKDPDSRKIWKVELQVKKTYRDEYNNVIKTDGWLTVPRVEFLAKDWTTP
jgi:hypothetical protein